MKSKILVIVCLVILAIIGKQMLTTSNEGTKKFIYESQNEKEEVIIEYEDDLIITYTKISYNDFSFLNDKNELKDICDEANETAYQLKGCKYSYDYDLKNMYLITTIVVNNSKANLKEVLAEQIIYGYDEEEGKLFLEETTELLKENYFELVSD